jgi:hypothetical protein
MKRHRRPRPKVPKHPPTHNIAPEILTTISLLYDDLVEVEALAVTSDEAVTNLPVTPTGKHKRTLARLYTLVAKTSGRAQGALERGEELVAQIAAARAGKRSPVRRVR